MSQDKLNRLRDLEKKIEQLKESRVRASERLTLLRQQRDGYIKELEDFGVNTKKVSDHLTTLAKSIETEIDKIEKQIPPNLVKLLANVENIEDRKEI